MHYLGGKFRTRDQIAAYLNLIRKPGQGYWEPFVGAGWVLEKIRGMPNWASDAHPYLIEMWKALQKGWQPPKRVSQKTYNAVKDHPDNYPPELVGFVGFGCSFSGKWFGGYARNERGQGDGPGERPYSEQSRMGLLVKIGHMEPVNFYQADFMAATPPALRLLIYCAPPYEGKTGYELVPEFDHDAFWNRVRRLTIDGHTVVVSEYTAPDDFACVVEMPTRTDMRLANGSSESRIEKLFRYGQHVPLQPSLF